MSKVRGERGVFCAAMAHWAALAADWLPRVILGAPFNPKIRHFKRQNFVLSQIYAALPKRHTV
ncbi:hypothetical protein HQN60_15200 [Deefgea piscis]|uniref:Uncharacterized protein n=1 Tax=Deefgea piscis TaxID=2739061 RepID=A0A6M8SZJ1_9NEIS|nr:hypothetical protein [Deefgea piscis]QKJ67959.1 hypothetical protein HQN60_15200 [Deefgea piscis]